MEMAWMKSIGIKGIKVDFFGGDKQHSLQPGVVALSRQVG